MNLDLIGDASSDCEKWIDALEHQFGMRCYADSTRSEGSQVESQVFGEVTVVDVSLLRQRLLATPSVNTVSHDGHVTLKLVTGGQMILSQNGDERMFSAGSMVLVDSAWSYEVRIEDSARFAAFKIQKKSLRDRGLQNSFSSFIVPNLDYPDVVTVRDLMLFIADQGDRSSSVLRARLGLQCLDLVGVIVIPKLAGLPPTKSEEVLLLRAKAVIEKHIGNAGATLSDISNELKISNNYLGRIFRNNGVSAMQYVWRRRLEHAKFLLISQRHLQIREIAYRCGFTNPNHFSRAFKQQYGLSPLQFYKIISNS
jgi:AraC-like DNA-binding protein